MNRWTRNLLVALLLAGAAGCATTNGGDPRDPLEGFNRAVYSFNEGFDQAIGKPVSTAYHDVLPGPARMMVRNFFGNLGDLWIGANNLLQGKPFDALTDWTRFAMNTTFGLFGILDWASEVGIEKHDEDFGQTMGRWGMDEGAYLVWPFIGSSTVRDSVGLVPDYYFDPVLRHKPKGVRYFAIGLRGVSRRADLLDASRILEEAALDKYVFQRDAHLQRRRNQVYDGNPPRAARQVPLAENSESAPVQQLAQPAVEPAAQPVAPALPSSHPAAAPAAAQRDGALESAAQMLEQPASPAATGGS